MEIRPIRGSGELSTKANMRKFVHHVADMEVRAFTMRETAAKCRAQAKNKTEEMTHARQRCLDLRNRLKQAHMNAQKAMDECTLKAFRKKKRTAGRVFAHLGLHYFCGAATVMAVYSIAWEGFRLPGGIVAIMMVLSALVYLTLFYIICFAISEKKYCQYILDLKEACDKAHAESLDGERALQNAEQQLADAVKQEKEIGLAADRLEQGADTITENLKRCYELGVIMPSYRNLVSVVILDDIFTNDKADTMREANLLCDTEIRHAELVGKLDEVVHALKTLASSIQSMSHILSAINTNVSLISQDIYRMAETQDEIKYAADAINSSADNADFYIAQRRAGAL